MNSTESTQTAIFFKPLFGDSSLFLRPTSLINNPWKVLPSGILTFDSMGGDGILELMVTCDSELSLQLNIDGVSYTIKTVPNIASCITIPFALLPQSTFGLFVPNTFMAHILDVALVLIY